MLHKAMFTTVDTTTEEYTRLAVILRVQKIQVLFEAGQNQNNSFLKKQVSLKVWKSYHRFLTSSHFYI